MNTWCVTARIGKDAELKNVNGKPMVAFAVAVESGWGTNKKTTWVDASLWGARGEKLVDSLKKGSMVGLVGEHGTREYNGKVITTLNVQDVTLLGDKRESAPRQAAPKPLPQSAPFDDDDLGTIPF